jgi:hypothetical protein
MKFGFKKLSRSLLVMCVCLGTSITVNSQESAQFDLSGVWSVNSLDVIENPAWDTEGLFSCRCTDETNELMRSILNDPSQDEMSARDIVERLEAHTLEVIADRLNDVGTKYGAEFDLADDPAIQCERFGAFRTVLHSDPINFETFEDRVVIKGEDLTVDRTIYLDRDRQPEMDENTPAGHSVGWYEGRSFVVETNKVTAGMVDDQLSLHHSDQAHSVERYTLNEAGNILFTSFTLYDPVMLKAPIIIERPRILTPGVSLELAPCEVISGQF